MASSDNRRPTIIIIIVIIIVVVVVVVIIIIIIIINIKQIIIGKKTLQPECLLYFYQHLYAYSQTKHSNQNIMFKQITFKLLNLQPII